MAPEPSLTLTKPLRKPDGGGFVGRRTLDNARAIAEAIFTTDEGPPPPERLDWLVADLEDFLARMGRSRTTFAFGILALSILAPLFARSFTSIRSMSVDDRIKALTRIENSAVAFAILGVKLLLSVMYYEHPEGAAQIGYDAQCMKAP